MGYTTIIIVVIVIIVVVRVCCVAVCVCCNAKSSFLGPLAGGYLVQRLGFEMASVVIGSFSLGCVSFGLIVFTVKQI